MVVKPSKPRKPLSRRSKLVIGLFLGLAGVVFLAVWKPSVAALVFQRLASEATRALPLIPFVSSFVLVILPLCLAFPGFLSSFEKRLKKNWRYRWALLGPCILFGVLGLVVTEQQRRKAEEKTDTLVTDAEAILKQVKGIASNVDNVAAKLAKLPDREETNAQLHEIRQQQIIEQEKGNTRGVSLLEQQADDVIKRQKDADYALSVARLPTVLDQLRNWKESFLETKTDVAGRRNDAPYTHRGKDLTDYYAALDARLETAQADSLENLRVVVTNADQLRQIMRGRLSTDLLRPEDEQWAQEFAEAKKSPYESFDGEAASKYLDDLKKRADASR